MDPRLEQDEEYQRLRAEHEEAIAEYEAGRDIGCASVIREGEPAPTWTLEEMQAASERELRTWETLHAMLRRSALIRGWPEPRRIGPPK